MPYLAYESLTCSLCKNIVTKSTLSSHAAEIFNAFQKYKHSPSSSTAPSSPSTSTSSVENVKFLLLAYEKAQMYTTVTSYCRYEILSLLCLELINKSMFEKVLPLSETLCMLASSIYPHGHPQVSVFYLQHVKLLRYLYGDTHKDISSYFKRALDGLSLSHPPSHDIFTSHIAPMMMWRVLCIMYHVLCTMYYVLCTMYHVPCTMYYVLCTMHYLRCTMQYKLWS